MINTNQKITFIVVNQSIDNQGFKTEIETELELIGSISASQMKIREGENIDRLVKALKIILKGYEIRKFLESKPKYVIHGGKRYRIIGWHDYPNHIEVNAL